AGEQVDFEIGDFQPRRLMVRGRASPQRFDASKQLCEGERLGEIVIAARTQAGDAIVNGAEGREDEHGGAIFLLAQSRNDLQTVDVRQLPIRDDDLIALGQRFVEPVATVWAVLDLIAVFAQALDQILGRLQIVVDEQQTHERADRLRPYSSRTGMKIWAWLRWTSNATTFPLRFFAASRSSSTDFTGEPFTPRMMSPGRTPAAAAGPSTRCTMRLPSVFACFFSSGVSCRSVRPSCLAA